MSSHDLLPIGREPESHERAVVGRIRLLDADVSKPTSHELRGSLLKLTLALAGEDHDMRPATQVPRTRFPCRMRDLRGEDALGEIVANDDVVVERLCRVDAMA